MEKNRIELTGTIRMIYRLKTKADGPMSKVLCSRLDGYTMATPYRRS